MIQSQLGLQLHELHYNLGWIWQQQAKLKQSAASYRQAILLGRQLEFGRSSGGTQTPLAFRPSIYGADVPDHLANAHHNLAVILAEQGQWQAATYYAQRAIALNPNLIPAYCNLGVVLLQQSKAEEAIAIFERALVLREQGVGAPVLVWASLYYGWGQALQYQDRHLSAIAVYRQALELSPDNAQLHYSLGLLLQQQDEHSLAIASFQQALSLDPTRLDIEADCGFSWLSLGQFERAMLCFQRSIALDQAWITAYSQGMRALNPDLLPDDVDEMQAAQLACRQFLTALQDYPQGCHIGDYFVQCLFHWGNVLTHYGGIPQLRQAVIYYRQAIQVQPQFTELYFRLADCLMQQGEQEAAMGVYDQLQQRSQANLEAGLQPQTPSVMKQLEQRQQWQSAIAYYRWSLKSHLPGVKFRNSEINSEAKTTIKACEGLNCTPCLKRITHEFEPTEIAPGIVRLDASVPTNIIIPTHLTVTMLHHGRAWTASKENVWQVCNAIAVFTAEGAVIPSLSRNYPGELPGCHQPCTLSRVPASESLGEPKFLRGKVAVLTGLSADVYFHWMVDILPRIEILKRNGFNLDKIDWFYLNSCEKAFQQETLKAFGIPMERVIESDRHPYIQATELIVPEFSGYLGWVQPWHIDLLREQLSPKSIQKFVEKYTDIQYTKDYNIDINGQLVELKAAQCPRQNVRQQDSNPLQRIYVSRSDAQHRRLLNEAMVVEVLKSLDFTILTLDQSSVTEQAQAFSQASLIVAPHGSSLTNLVFCNRGTKIVELVSPNYVRPYYWSISRHLQLEHYLVRGEEFSCTALRQLMYPSPMTEDIWVDVDRLEQTIQLLL